MMNLKAFAFAFSRGNGGIDVAVQGLLMQQSRLEAEPREAESSRLNLDAVC